jgi:hypothetical protein
MRALAARVVALREEKGRIEAEVAALEEGG